MKHTLRRLAGLAALPVLALTLAEAASFPEKDPVFTYEAPEKWKTVADKEGGIALNSADGKISVNFAVTPVEASMEVFKEMLPAMVKTLDEPAEAKKPEEHTEDGLTGYTATYNAKVDGKPASCVFVLFKGGKERSVLTCVVISDPASLPKEDGEAMDKMMNSMKGVASGAAGKAEAARSFPEKKPLITFAPPANWTTEIDKEDGSIAINSDSERISVNFAEVPVTASVETLEKMLPDMIKELDEPVVAKKPAEHTEDGLTGYSATYTGKIDDKPAACVFVLFKGEKDRAVLGCIVLGEPDSLSKEDSEAMGAFMNSVKAAK